MTQVVISNAAVEFGATTLFSDITVTIAAGERWGIVGRNGTGKTTLFKLLTGERQPTRGQVVRQPGVTVSLLEQHRDFGDATTVWDAAAGQFQHLLELEHSLERQAAALADHHDDLVLEQYGHDLERFEREGGYTFRAQVDAVLQGLGFDPVEARTRPIGVLSGGERGRVGLGRQLVSPATVLLLDEPTNHLDLETTRWLEEYLRVTEKTVVLVSHDRAFLAAVADHVLHFESGTATPYTGGYEAFVAQRMERRLTLQRQFDKQGKVIAAEQDYIARNLAGQNSRQAKGRRKRLERVARLSAPPGEDDTMALRFEIAERGGDQIAVAERAVVAVAGRTLIEDFTARLMRGDRLGIVGPNGAGKSTLLRTLLGEHELAGGELRLGGAVRPAYYRQDMAQVPLDKTLYDIIAELRPHWERRQVQGHLGRFGFSGDEAQRRPESLSGGERARIALAMIMLSHANLLILDEPTNHLDVESVETIEDAIEAYEGTVVLVSHDRALLRALVTRVWELREGRVIDFAGTFGEWEEAEEERRDAELRARREADARDREREQRKRQQQAPDAGEQRRQDERRMRREREQAERRAAELEVTVGRLEGEVAALQARVDDPALYRRTDGGGREAEKWRRELGAARKALDVALQAWAEASEQAGAAEAGA